jgi:hypothetical protein
MNYGRKSQTPTCCVERYLRPGIINLHKTADLPSVFDPQQNSVVFEMSCGILKEFEQSSANLHLGAAIN